MRVVLILDVGAGRGEVTPVRHGINNPSLAGETLAVKGGRGCRCV